MKKIFLFLLLIFMSLTLGALLLFLAWLRHWTPWVAVLAPILFLVLPGFYILVKSLVTWRENRRYAKNVLHQEKQVVAPPEIQSYSFWRQKWRHGIIALRSSALAGRVNPILDLPWFLALGGEKAGHGSVLAAANLINNYKPSLSGVEAGQTEESGCGWYFFDRAIFFDSGRIFCETPAPNPENATSETAEQRWNGFLDLLTETRKGLGLNGVVLMVPAELLRLEKEGELLNYALLLRDRLNTLSRRTDLTCPVYALLTGLELWPDLEEALADLAAEGIPTGLLFDPKTGPTREAAATITNYMELHLKDVFLRHLDQRQPERLAGLMAAPQIMAALERPLAVFMDTLTHVSPYAPPPMLRGVFFTSTARRRAGTEPGDGLATAPAAPGPERNLHTLFNDLLPQNSSLTRPLNLPGGRRQKTMVTGLTLFYLGSLFLCFMFYLNVRHSREISEAREAPAKIMPHLSDNSTFSEWGALGKIFTQEKHLKNMENIQKSWILRGFGPNRSENLISSTKRDFMDDFDAVSDRMIDELNRQLADSHADPSSPDFAMTLRQLLWLFSVYSAWEKGQDIHALSNVFPILPPDFKGPSRPYWNIVFSELLFDYLDRNPERSVPLENYNLVKICISNAVALQGYDLDWLISWAGYLPELEPIQMTKFWNDYGQNYNISSLAKENEIKEVPPAYTLRGREAIKHAAEQLELIYKDMGRIVGNKATDFMNTYDQTYLRTWQAFTASFIDISERLLAQISLDDFFQQRNIMLAETSPYNILLTALNENLRPFMGRDDSPAWLKNLELDNAIMAWSADKSKFNASRSSGPIASKLETYASTLSALQEQMPQYYYRTDFVERIMDGQPYLEEFSQEQKNITDIIRNQPEQALKLAAVHFGGAAYGDVNETPLTKAKKAMDGYTHSLYLTPGKDVTDDLTADIRYAILDSLSQLLIKDAARLLDKLWESEVLAPTQFLNDDETRKILFAGDGLINKFVTDHAAPFLERKTLGYTAGAWGNRPFPFSYDFLHLLSVGDSEFKKEPILDSYTVTIEALASTVNMSAKERPQKTTLKLKAPDETQTFDNFNFPNSKAFVWKPGASEDLTLEISFPSLELTINYSGKNAFPSFLNDIMPGEYVLTPDDFPGYAQQLQALGIEAITVQMRPEGALPVIRYFNLSAPPLPASIINIKSTDSKTADNEQ